MRQSYGRHQPTQMTPTAANQTEHYMTTFMFFVISVRAEIQEVTCHLAEILFPEHVN